MTRSGDGQALGRHSPPRKSQQPGPRRVLFVITSSDFGGSENLLRELTLRLHGGDFEPLLLSLRPPGRMAADVVAAGVPVLSLEMSERPRVPELIAGIFRLARKIDELGIDLVYSCLYRANILAGISSRLARRRPRMVSAQHSLIPESYSFLSTFIARRTWRFSDRIIAISEAVKEVLIDADRVPAERVVVLESGIDTARYRDLDRAAARRKLGLGQEAIIVGSVGRMVQVKGFDLLLTSVAQLTGEGLQCDLLLSGEGPERLRLEEQARALGLANRIRFLGYHPDITEVYAALDIFILPSLSEGSPTTLLEAMASGCALVATRVGGVPAIIEHERSGLLVEPGSSLTITEALRRILADPESRRRLADGAQLRARKKFDISLMVGDHRRLFHALLANR